MSRIQTVKEIHDSIWGTIGLTESELKVLSHPLIQRLRRISQLGLVNMVYPSSGHSRLSHSLGVFALATRVGRHLCEIGDFTLEEYLILRIAALVHDVGHYPLSHSTEEFYKSTAGKDAKHESVGAYLIRNTSLGDAIDSALEKTGWDRDAVADIIQGRKPDSMEKAAVWQLINSQFDLDRMDYLIRDGTAVGLDYGRIDFSRILSKIVVDKEYSNIGVDIRASTAIENYILARYYLWDAVYLHKAVMGFEIIQTELCKCLCERDLFPNFKAILEKIQNDSIIEFDDSFFWTSLYNGMKVDTRIDALGRMLRDRHPLKLAYEAPPPQDPLLVDPRDTLSRARPYAEDPSIVNDLPVKAKIDADWFFPKRVEISIHEFIPLVEDEIYEPEYEKRREEAKEARSKTIRLFHIKKDGTRTRAGYLAMNPQSVIFDLKKFKKLRFRFYTHPKHEGSLKGFLKSKIELNQPT